MATHCKDKYTSKDYNKFENGLKLIGKYRDREKDADETAENVLIEEERKDEPFHQLPSNGLTVRFLFHFHLILQTHPKERK